MEGELVEHGTVIVDGDRIEKIVPGTSSVPSAEVIDLSDCLLLPGFVNCHCHLSLSALGGGMQPRQRFTDWISDLLRLNAKISDQEKWAAMDLGAEEMLQSGVTTLADYFPETSWWNRYEGLPFRQVLFLEVLGFRKSVSQSVLEQVKAVLEKYKGRNPLIDIGIAPHAPYSVSPGLFEALVDLAKAQDCPVSCHVAEFKEEIRFLREGGVELEQFLKERQVYEESWEPPGVSAIEYLQQIGVLDGMLAVHMNHIREDLGRIEDSESLRAVFCPGSTRWFGRKEWMPVQALLDIGIPVGLGTDSLASNKSLNYFDELRAAQKMLPEIGPLDLLKMATRFGAQALGVDAGVLAPGKKADIIGLKMEDEATDWPAIPFKPGRKRVDFSMVDGKVVLL